MIVSHQYRYIFLGLPKTASTSLAIALSKYCGPDDIISKVSRKDEEVRRTLGHRGPQNELRPWHAYPLRDLLYSFLRRGRRPQYKHPRAVAVRRYLGDAIWDSYYKFCIERNPFDRAISLYYFVKVYGRPLPPINDFICMTSARQLSNWPRYTAGNRILVDHVARYEDLTTELTRLSARLGLPPLELPQTKAAYREDRRHYSQVLNQAARRRIERVCAREIEMFSYQWTDAGH